MPANLRVAGLAETSVTVEWDAPADAGTPYAYTLRGADEAGNQGAESDPVTLDATSGVARYRVLVDGAVATETDRTGATVTGLRRGVAHLVQVIAIDGAGNESEPSAELSAGEDLIPARPAGLAAATPTNAAPIVTWPAVEDAESYLVRRDGEELGSVTEPRFVDDALADEGEHAYTVAAVGPAGKPSPWSEPLAVVYDVTPPDTELLARTPDPTRATASVEFRAPGAGTTFRCAVDDAAATTCTSPWNISGLTTGEHVLAVTATDAAGNVEDEPLRIVVETDADAPAAPTLTAEALRDAPEGVLRTRLAAAPTDDATRIVVSTGDRIVHDGAAVSDLLDASPLAPEITYVAVAYDVAGNVPRRPSRRPSRRRTASRRSRRP